MDGRVYVIITDGFTGNIALKTAEGTANFITENFKNSLNKLSQLLSYNSLKKFKDKLDPRKYNGAIFLGLQSPVVKSHGSTDAVGFSHSINVCTKIVRANLIKKIESNLGFSRNFSSTIIDNFFDILIRELLKSNKVKISSFGTFKVINKKERIGRNPKTKIEAKIVPRKVVKFKPSLLVKEKLNSS